MTIRTAKLRRIALTAGAAALLGLAALPSGAGAQAYDDRYDEGDSTLGGVTVIAPRRMERDPATGAPIETVFANRVVRYDDLDLNHWQDRRELHARVVRAAEAACDELDSRYPITASDSPPCVRDAVRRAMYRVEVAENDD